MNEYREAAVQDIETCLSLLRKIHFMKEVRLTEAQLIHLRSVILTLSQLEEQLCLKPNGGRKPGGR